MTIGHHSAETGSSSLAAKQLALDLSPYRRPSRLRSLLEITATLGPFAIIWTTMWFSLQVSYALTLVLAIPAAFFLVRVFLIQHDCGHGTLFRRRATNDWLGRALSILTLAPYDFWQRDHAVHHATSGNLDRRGTGDIDTLTVAEYRALPTIGRLRYRLYRHPAVMFGIGPAYLFLLQFRLPVRQFRNGWRPWLSTMATNGAVIVAASGMIWLVGLQAFLLVHLPIVVLAATIGVWLFYVQHQFDGTSWDNDADWNVHEAALDGSSYYKLPRALEWLTANIGIHHVHHLCSRIPFYRLPEVLRDYPDLASVGTITPLESLRCVRLVLWDEDAKRLISFSEFAEQSAGA